MKNLTLADLTFEIITDYETESMEGNLIDSGDAEQDAEIIEKVQDDLNAGNVWAWCTVEVKATYKGILTSSDYLGMCSYANEKEFIEGGYYEDMQNTCLSEIQEQLNTLTA